MAEDGANRPADISGQMIHQLRESGFFQQMEHLEKSLAVLSTDIGKLGQTATQRLEETESLAAHVLAIEALLSVLVKSCPVDGAAVEAAVRDKTAAMAGKPGGSKAVHAIVQGIVGSAPD